MSQRFLALLALTVTAPLCRAAEPGDRELIEAVQRQVKTVMDGAEPAVVGVVVSHSESYPNRPASAATSGRLGSYDRAEFLKSSMRPDKSELARRLDLADPASIPDNAYACGVVIDTAGLVLTTYHAIDGATKLYVRLPGGRGSYADVHAADARADLAVLRLIVPPKDLKTIRIADVRTNSKPGVVAANVERGKWVVLMANTFDSAFVDKPAGAMGLITATRERTPTRRGDETQSRLWTVYHYGILLQYVNQFPTGRMAKLNIGCSGGALLNFDGELLGLTTTAGPLAGAEDAAGFALPLDENARRVLAVLRRGEEVEYGFLGVNYDTDPILPDRLGTRGIPIRVTPGGPAEQAGLRNNDLIVRVNGHAIEDSKDLILHIGSSLAGGTAKVVVQRSSDRGFTPRGNPPRELEVGVVLGKYQHGLPFIASNRPEPVFGLRVDRGSVLNQQLLGNDLAATIPPGVVVRELLPGSPAAEKFKGLNDGAGRWIITAVGGMPVATPAAFYAEARGKPAVTLTLTDVTDQQTRQLNLP